ncbi:MAG: HD domain-containing protein [Clostridia bacterium]|nr:HD domain-containing protein [Clostridia bacterium]
MSKELMYDQLSDELQKRICQSVTDKNILNDTSIRRDSNHDKANLWRPAYVRDVEKIMHSPYYNRYADKTQVFSLYKNDDISHRAYHVQLVSRIARNIGRMLNLDLDLIEAIALGHDIGHTPFGHAGERFLNELYYNNTGRYFNHNVHSVRVLDKIFNLNISLQTLDGILCHNGEFECKEYRPSVLTNFEEFDKKVEQCYIDKNAIKKLIPSTLEGCVVRICDIIAYVGKDRQDAVKTNIIPSEDIFKESPIGKYNAVIINNMIVNIVENSYGKDYIMLDDEHFQALSQSKSDNFTYIYNSDAMAEKYDEIIKPMFLKIYNRLLDDIINKNKNSVIYKHHIDFINKANRFNASDDYSNTEPNQIAVDFIASMTDDYFIDLYEYLFDEHNTVQYISYFNDIK